MNHAVLLGDSIFDNAIYVPGKLPVIEQFRESLPAGWKATLLAVDGNVTADVQHQVSRLPDDATHLFVSSGGNDALGHASILNQPAGSVAEVLEQFTSIRTSFQQTYRQMIESEGYSNFDFFVKDFSKYSWLYFFNIFHDLPPILCCNLVIDYNRSYMTKFRS